MPTRPVPRRPRERVLPLAISMVARLLSGNFPSRWSLLPSRPFLGTDSSLVVGELSDSTFNYPDSVGADHS